MATWTTPKTDWEKGDQFNYTDYNRIKNNITYINDMLNEMYPDKAISIDLGDDLTYNAGYTSSQFNAFEDAVESFKRSGQDYVIGNTKHFNGNDAFIDYAELNRLEKICAKYKTVSSTITSIEFENLEHKVYVDGNVTRMLSFYIKPTNADVSEITFNTDSKYLSLTNPYVYDASTGHYYINFIVLDDSSFNGHTIPDYEDVPVTVTANAGKVGASTVITIAPNGTYYTDSEGNSPVSFIKGGDNKDGAGLTTMFCLAVNDAENIFGATNNTVRENGSNVRRKMASLISNLFSSTLKREMQIIDKLGVKTCTASGYTTETLHSNFHIPSISEFGVTPPSEAVPLGNVVYDISNVGQYILTRDRAYINGNVYYYEMLHTTGFMQGGTIGDGAISEICPTIYLNSSVKVKRNGNSGFYYFDWKNESATSLADLPSGTRVFDIGHR